LNKLEKSNSQEMIEKSDVCEYWWCVKSSGKTKTPIARVLIIKFFYIDYEGIKCHCQVILQLEFHLFRGINKKNNEDLSDYRIYDDAFLKNIIEFKLC
jgi:hypothetical protein